MKNRFYVLILAGAIASPLAQAGGILVFDASSKIENTLQWKKEAKQWLETTQHYKDQIQAYKEHMLAISGVRDVEAFVDQAKSLKSDFEKFRKPGQALNDLLLSGGASGQFDALYNKYKIFDTCNVEQSKSYTEVCKQEVNNKAMQIEQTDEIQKQITETLGDILC